MFAHGWDAEREQRLARQKEMGIVPQDTRLPPRNDGVKAVGRALRRRASALFTRLQAAYAAMLDHADQHLARLVAFLETAGQLDDTLIIVMSDNGASQEGGPLGMVNAMGPYNFRREPIEEKIAPHRRHRRAGHRIPTSRWAGRWRPTRRCAATSRTPMAAASAIRS